MSAADDARAWLAKMEASGVQRTMHAEHPGVLLAALLAEHETLLGLLGGAPAAWLLEFPTFKRLDFSPISTRADVVRTPLYAKPGTASAAVPIPREPFDPARFSNAPCYLCGYNGAGYFQPPSHLCAVKYHATIARSTPNE